jgi:hypothetical protein
MRENVASCQEAVIFWSSKRRTQARFVQGIMKRKGHGINKKGLILRRIIVSLYYKVPRIRPLIPLTSAVWKSKPYKIYNSAPPRNISGFLRPVKDEVGLKKSGVYSIA